MLVYLISHCKLPNVNIKQHAQYHRVYIQTRFFRVPTLVYIHYMNVNEWKLDLQDIIFAIFILEVERFNQTLNPDFHIKMTPIICNLQHGDQVQKTLWTLERNLS